MPRRSTHGARGATFLLAMPSSSSGKPASHVQIFANGDAPARSRRHLSSSSSSACGGGRVALLAVGLRTLLLVAVYFAFSIGLTFYQKRLIRRFPFPLSVVVCHVILKFALAALCRAAAGWAPFAACRRDGRTRWWRFQCCGCGCGGGRLGRGGGGGGVGVSEEDSGDGKAVLGWQVYCRAVAVTAISSAFDIGFSNWSFEYITVSLYTMTKSTSIVFILLFSVCLGLEKLKASLAVIVVCISAGLVLFNYESTQFNVFGFALVLSASFLSGVRWSYAQLIMQSKSSLGLDNPVDMVYHVQPWMLVALLPFSASVEGKALVTCADAFAAPSPWDALRTLGAVAVGALVAFAMEVSEYLLVLMTSSLTLSIAGVWKEVLTLVLDFRINRSRFSPTNVVGLALCFAGIVFHLVVKARDVEGRVGSPPPTTTKTSGRGGGREEATPLRSFAAGSVDETDDDTGDEVALLDRSDLDSFR